MNGDGISRSTFSTADVESRLVLNGFNVGQDRWEILEDVNRLHVLALCGYGRKL